MRAAGVYNRRSPDSALSVSSSEILRVQPQRPNRCDRQCARTLPYPPRATRDSACRWTALAASAETKAYRPVADRQEARQPRRGRLVEKGGVRTSPDSQTTGFTRGRVSARICQIWHDRKWHLVGNMIMFPGPHGMPIAAHESSLRRDHINGRRKHSHRQPSVGLQVQYKP